MLISGYYGSGNAGDEAVLSGIKTSFEKTAGETIQLTVLSQNPTLTTSQHNLSAVYRMDRKRIREELSNTNLLLSGGGSLLQDTSSLRSLLYYLWVCHTAMSMNVPVMFYAQGIGPLKRKISRALVRNIANRAAFLTVRDASSAELLRQIGVHNPNLEVTADPAFCLQPADKQRILAIFREADIPSDGKYIGVALRSWSEGNLVSSPSQYAKLLDALEEITGCTPTLIPMQLPQDLKIADKIASLRPQTLILRSHLTPSELMGIIGEMHAVVAMRLHALIFAARMQIPMIALNYDPKVDTLMHQLELPEFQSHWSQFDPSVVATKTHELIESWPSRKENFNRITVNLQTSSLRSAEIANLLLK